MFWPIPPHIGNTMNKGQTEGMKKEVAGRILGDNVMVAKGKAKNKLGKVQTAFGDFKQEIKESNG